MDADVLDGRTKTGVLKLGNCVLWAGRSTVANYRYSVTTPLTYANLKIPHLMVSEALEAGNLWKNMGNRSTSVGVISS